MIPAVIYAARSQAEEPGKDSTGDQIAIIRERLEREPDRFIYGEPHKDHASGFHGNRGPGLEAALDAATRAASEHGRAELWVFKSERLARGSGRRDEARSVMEVYVDTRRAGVDLRSVEDDEYFTNPMLVGIADAMAHKYSRDLSTHIKRGIASFHAKGKPWGTPAYGFRKRDDGHWEADPEERPIIARIFELYLSSGSYNRVASTLAAEKIPTRNSATWDSSLIGKIITGRWVLGEYRFKGEWHQGQHPAIIDTDTWQAAQALAEQSRRWTPKGGGRLPARHVFVRGFLKCAYCGATMLPRTERRGGKVVETYQCSTRKTRGVEACSMPIFPREAVEVPALQMFERGALDFEATRKHIAGQLDARINEATAQAVRASREATELRSQADRVERDYRRGALPAEDYARLRTDIADERAAAEAEAERLTAHVAAMAGTRGNLDAEEEALRRLTELRSAIAGQVNGASHDVGALRAAIAAVFVKFVVVPASLMGVTDAEADQFEVVAEVRPEMLRDDASENARDPLRRVSLPLGMDAAEPANNAYGSRVAP